jgi:hypothetical protein
MIGAGALLECLADPRVTAVRAITRSPTGRSHPKVVFYPAAMRSTAVAPGEHHYARVRLCFHAIEGLARRPALAGGSR